MRAQGAGPEVALGGAAGSTGNAHSIGQWGAARKWQRVLRALLDGPRTTRQLEREPVFDHCAHSTASELRKKGLPIVTEMIEVSGYAGEPARIARYSLDPTGRERALKLLGHGP